MCLLQGYSLKRPLVIGKSALGLYILDKGNVQDLDARFKTNQLIVECLRNDSCENKFLHDYNASTVASHLVFSIANWDICH